MTLTASNQPHRIVFTFDLNRALIAMVQIVDALGEVDKAKLIKLLYIADKSHFLSHGSPITGDTPLAMKWGPVPCSCLEDWETAVAVANASRRAGDLERAVTMFAEGAGHDPQDVTCLLEIGDIRLDQDRWADALGAYEKTLAKDADHQWALPSAFYCRYRLGVPGQWLASLREVANQEGCTCGLEGCLTSIFGGYGSSQGIERATYLLGKIDN